MNPRNKMLKENTDVGKWSHKDSFSYEDVKNTPQFIVKYAYIKNALKDYGTIEIELSNDDILLMNKFNSFVDTPLIVESIKVKPNTKIINHAFEVLNNGDCVNCHLEYKAVTEYKGKLYNKYELKAFKVVAPPTVEMNTDGLD